MTKYFFANYLLRVSLVVMWRLCIQKVADAELL